MLRRHPNPNLPKRFHASNLFSLHDAFDFLRAIFSSFANPPRATSSRKRFLSNSLSQNAVAISRTACSYDDFELIEACIKSYPPGVKVCDVVRAKLIAASLEHHHPGAMACLCECVRLQSRIDLDPAFVTKKLLSFEFEISDYLSQLIRFCQYFFKRHGLSEAHFCKLVDLSACGDDDGIVDMWESLLPLIEPSFDTRKLFQIMLEITLDLDFDNGTSNDDDDASNKDKLTKQERQILNIPTPVPLTLFSRSALVVSAIAKQNPSLMETLVNTLAANPSPKVLRIFSSTIPFFLQSKEIFESTFPACLAILEKFSNQNPNLVSCFCPWLAAYKNYQAWRRLHPNVVESYYAPAPNPRHVDLAQA